MSTNPPDDLDEDTLFSDGPEHLASTLAGLHAQNLRSDGGPLQVGLLIGPYRLQRLLGRGGMGEVFLAEQLHPVRREVAVKLIQRRISSAFGLACFEVERQVLAQLNHPGIARLFDAGTTADGYPYFVMEYVDGEPVAQFCDQQGLDARDRLRLFRKLCLAVQHAHQHGVIHRDLKPANVLVTRVDDEPWPCIIDFGIATASGDRSSLGSADNPEVVGTPEYMSPEQVNSKRPHNDVRSDVYALGVMLFELLTATHPLDTTLFRSGRREDVQRALGESRRRSIQEAWATWKEHSDKGDIPARLAGLNGLERNELQAIVNRAMARDLEQRYPSALDLVSDIDALLSQRTVSAMPPQRRYVWRKFVARHRLMLAALTLAAVALLAGLAATLWSLDQAQTQRHIAEQAALRAEAESAKNAQTAEFLRGLLGGVNPIVADELDKTLLLKVLDDAAQRVSVELAEQPDVAASVLQTIADSYAALGFYQQAEDAYRQAMAVRADVDNHVIEYKLARMLLVQGMHLEAEVALQDVLALQKAVPGVSLEDIDRTHIDLAWVSRERGEFEQARQVLEEISNRLRIELGPDHSLTLQALGNLAVVVGDLGDTAGSERLHSEVLDASRRTLGPRHPETLTTLHALAISIMQQGRHAEAVEPLLELLAANQSQLGDDHPQVLRTTNLVGSALRQSGQPERSEPYYRRSVEGFIARFGVTHSSSVLARHNYALLKIDLDDAAAALADLREIEQPWTEQFGADNSITGVLHGSIGHALSSLGRHDEAEVAMALATDIFDRAELAEDHFHRRRLEGYLDALRAARNASTPGD